MKTFFFSHLIDTHLLICLENGRTIHSVRKLILCYPLAVVLPALSCNLRDFDISPKIHLKIPILIFASRTPGTFLSSSNPEI